MAAKIRKGDTVVVIAGRDKGRTGEVIEVRPAEESARKAYAAEEGALEVRVEKNRVFKVGGGQVCLWKYCPSQVDWTLRIERRPPTDHGEGRLHIG